MLKPSVTFSHIFPEDVTYTARTCLTQIRALGFDQSMLEPLSAIVIAVAGEIPLICHRGAINELIMRAFLRAGVMPAKTIHTYDSEKGFLDLLRQQIVAGRRLASVFPLPIEAATSTSLLVPPSLYDRINNKAEIDSLVPAQALPPNLILPPDKWDSLMTAFRGHHVFVKACHNGPSGGGSGVFHCASDHERWLALERIRSYPVSVLAIRVELAVDLLYSSCVSVAIREDDVFLLGAATQIFSAPAKQSGSIIDAEHPTSPEILRLALIIAENCRKTGYRGIAGFDIGLGAKGKVFAFDLNFRLAASTAQILMHDAAASRLCMTTTRSFSLLFSGKIERILDALAPELESGRFVPLRIYDAGGSGPHVISGFVVGESAAHCEELCARISGMAAACE